MVLSLEFAETRPLRAGIERTQRDAKYFATCYGKRLRCLRTVLGVTEKAFAAAHPIALRTYRKMEAGTPVRLSNRKLMNFVETYNISLDWILDGRGSMFRRNRSRRKGPTKLAPNVVDFCAFRKRKDGAA